MAEYIPGTSVTRSAAMTALHHAKAPDDNDVESRSSVINVDYLSHNWEEEADVWASWRYTTKNKNDISHGVRLENASWRTWWKQRNHLKTISPETLNWLKDSDVTWLYGPLHTAADPVPTPKQATTVDKLDLVKVDGKKPILKHRSISELLASSPRASSPSLDSAMHHDGDGRPPLIQSNSESNIFGPGSRKVSPPRTISTCGRVTRSDSSSSRHVGSDNESVGQQKHISFNRFVEQCIAIDKPRSTSSIAEGLLWASSEPLYGNEHEDEYEDEDSSLLTMRSSSLSGGSSRPSPIHRPSSNRRTSSSSDKERFTIAPIAPAMLKTVDYDDGISPAVVFVPPVGSPFADDPTSFGRYSGNATLHLEGSVPSSRGLNSFWDADEADDWGGLYLGSGNSHGSLSGGRSHNASISNSQKPNDIAPSSPVGSPPTQRHGTRSILKNGSSADIEAAMRALREAADQPDSYFSSSPIAALLPPVTSTLESETINRSTTSPSSSHQPSADIPRGRSTVRTSSNIEERERSSSKGSSPIGSVSPTPSHTGSTARKVSCGPVYVGVNKDLLGRDSTTSTTHVDVYKLPSRVVDVNRPDPTFPASRPQSDSHGLILPVDGTRQLNSSARNDQFKIGADLVSVLPSAGNVEAASLNGDAAAGFVGGRGETMTTSKSASRFHTSAVSSPGNGKQASHSFIRQTSATPIILEYQ